MELTISSNAPVNFQNILQCCTCSENIFSFFFWLELCASKYCTYFKESILFIRHRQSFLWNTKTYRKDICNINILFSLHKVFYKQILSIHSYLVCAQTAKNATCNSKIWNTFLSWKRSVQAKKYCCYSKCNEGPSE